MMRKTTSHQSPVTSHRYVAALVLALICGAASAQTYPSRPIRMLIPFAPGGATDIIARMIEPRMTRSLGQQIVVDNRPGAAGNIAVELTAEGVLAKRQTPISLSESPADFNAYVLSELKRWDGIIKANKVKID